ncbi:MAG: gliding motility-associated C-terminal domain-containing protein [Bacteroidetes bacterium]|nr:gliding motility-associated C-terminal domain-containing protein [Bacteroidota bacterium]
MHKRILTNIFTLFFILIYALNSNGQVNITGQKSAQQLVNRLVGYNVTVLNPKLRCASKHNGEFTTISSNLGLSGGIILATGTATTLAGSTGAVGQDSTSDGDSSLSALIGGTPTNDACILEFDFVPDIDTASLLKFDYVFGSEEYPGYTCSNFNDVFGFLISGPGYNPAVNIALVPGTNIPVAINSVNSGVASGGYSLSTCQAMGPGSPFPAYFVNNQSVPTKTIVLPGFTTVLQASALVYPCDTYHMKLGVANASDHALQSAVFLKENSFSVDTVKLNLSGIIKSHDGYLVRGCTSGALEASRSQASAHKKKICLSYGGTVVNGVDYTFLADSIVIPPSATTASITINPLPSAAFRPGWDTLIIRRLNCCTKQPVDSIAIKIRDSLKMELLSVDTSMCGSSAMIPLHATGDSAFQYLWTPSTLVSNPIDTQTTATITGPTTFTITASYKSCPPISHSFTAVIEPNPIVTILPHDTSFCLADPYPIYVTVDPSSFTQYHYQWSPTSSLDNANTSTPFFYTNLPGIYKYILTVNTPLGCNGSDSVTIETRPEPKLINVTGDFIAKYGDVVQLHAEGATFYTWTPSRLLDYPIEANPKATAIDTATFQVIGTDQYGCRDTAYVHMGIDYHMYEFIPNAFTPNGDGHNDVFSVRHMKFQRLIEFRIFNRWGEEVYSSTDMNNGWDGTFKGVPQEAGVYHYLIRITTPDGGQRMYKGDVTLVR